MAKFWYYRFYRAGYLNEWCTKVTHPPAHTKDRQNDKIWLHKPPHAHWYRVKWETMVSIPPKWLLIAYKFWPKGLFFQRNPKSPQIIFLGAPILGQKTQKNHPYRISMGMLYEGPPRYLYGYGEKSPQTIFYMGKYLKPPNFKKMVPV